MMQIAVTRKMTAARVCAYWQASAVPIASSAHVIFYIRINRKIGLDQLCSLIRTITGVFSVE